VRVKPVTELDLPTFDYYGNMALRGEHYHEVVRELASRSWLATSPLAFFVFEREAGEIFLRSKKTTFPGHQMATIFDIKPGPLYDEIANNILHVNGEQHSRLRNLVNPAFTPKAANRWRPAMQGFLAQLWDGVAADGRCEFVEAFAKPYPSLTIATLMGADLADAPRLHHWSNWIQAQFDFDLIMNQRDKIEQAVVEFMAWATELLERRRDDPGDDLISTLLAAEAEGDRLSDVECVNLVLNVLVGGVDTTQSQLTQAIRVFAEHPDQWALLAQQPELAGAAVWEVLRYEPITPFTARIMLEDLEVHDVLFPKDTIVMVGAVSANREGETGEVFDITADRPPARALTFGAGVHYCLGANLARAELEEALTFLAPRMPNLRLDGEPRFGTVTGIYGMDALPVAWG
jgi:cytochrome P450